MAICFSFVAFVFPWERWFIGLLMFLFFIFFIKSQFLKFVFIFEAKVLQEDLLVSSMINRVFALCYLYLFRFSDEGFVLNFLKVAWCSLMFLFHSTVNYGLCFGDIVVLGIVLFAMVMWVLAKYIMGYWFAFDSGISVVRQFLFGFPFCFFDIPSWGSYLWFWFFFIVEFSIIIG